MFLLLFWGNKPELDWEQSQTGCGQSCLDPGQPELGSFPSVGSTILILLLPQIPPGAVGKQRITKSLGWKHLEADLIPSPAMGRGSSCQKWEFLPGILFQRLFLGSFQSVGGTHRQNKTSELCLPPSSNPVLHLQGGRKSRRSRSRNLGLGFFRNTGFVPFSLPAQESFSVRIQS